MQEQKLKKILRPVLLIVSLLVILSMARGTLGLLTRGEAIEEAQEKVESLREEQARLLELKERVETEEFVEKEAREKLGLAKPGEVVVVLPEEEILARLAPDLEEEDFLEELPIWKRWVRMFF